MNATTESARARRYLLGAVDEDERALIERDYFTNDDALDRVTTAEDDLIEDYLAGRLTPHDRWRFEHAYLAAPGHRARVDTVRRLIARAAVTEATQRVRSEGRLPAWRPAVVNPVVAAVSLRWLAAAASIVLVASAAVWLWASMNRTAPTRIAAQPALSAAPAVGQPSASAPATRAFALMVSPVGVRGAAAERTVVIPEGAQRVTIRLGLDADTMSFATAHVSVRVVGGEEVWKGMLVVPGGEESIGSIDVAASQLTAEDYVITVQGMTGDGRQQSVRYFLRVRQ
jgi:hypothetical protein